MASPPGTLTGALPLMMIPPQSPALRQPTYWSLLKTIGMSAVPSAQICAPRAMTRVPFVANSPNTSVPGSIVSRAGASTKTAPLRTQ